MNTINENSENAKERRRLKENLNLLWFSAFGLAVVLNHTVFDSPLRTDFIYYDLFFIALIILGELYGRSIGLYKTSAS
jgi:hypothetical protein